MKNVLFKTTGLFVLTLTFIFIYGCGPDLGQFDHLKKPAIRTITRQKMIGVKIEGDPNKTTGRAAKALYETIFKLKKDINGFKIPALRARWPKGSNIPKDEWVGIFGLPIPENINSLPKIKSGIKVNIEYWEYGEIAEILHIGPYNKETLSVEKLHEFINEQGYQIAGDHEEEYLKGPGMIFKGNPNIYRTIIRYRVEQI